MIFELFKHYTVYFLYIYSFYITYSIGGKPSKSVRSPLSDSIEPYLGIPKQMAPSVKSSNKNSILCADPQFDAIFIIDDDTYLFKGMLKIKFQPKQKLFFVFHR
jgi:hypothetical protein